MLQQSKDFIPKLKSSPMYAETLNQQDSEILHIISTLEIPSRRSTRSINFIGSALKFVAGNPDHDDYELLLTKQHFLIENNNRQTKINSILQNRINEITEQLNIIRKGFSNNAILKENNVQLFEFLANRNNLIINYLNNIALSIVLAKNNLINPLILDQVDIEKIIENENSRIPISVNNLLLVSKVKILQNDELIHYILKIPKIKNYCNYLKIYPVSHKNSIVKLEFNEAAKCNDFVYPISDCVKTTSEQICRPVLSPCLTNLLNNDTAECPTESSYHVETIREVDDGIIILNNVIETVITDANNVTINGTFLITFINSIKINNTVFSVKKNATVIEAHPAKTVLMKSISHENKISMPYLHKINLENTNEIANLTEEFQSNKTLWWIISGAFVIFTGAIVSVFFIRCLVRNVCCPSTSQNVISREQLDEIIVGLRTRNEDVSN